jgi:high-affinity K+ transport system ATPase subunit B
VGIENMLTNRCLDGVGGIIAPFIGIKVIDVLVSVLRLA